MVMFSLNRDFKMVTPSGFGGNCAAAPGTRNGTATARNLRYNAAIVVGHGEAPGLSCVCVNLPARGKQREEAGRRDGATRRVFKVGLWTDFRDRHRAVRWYLP